ncbi:MAG: acyl-CoA thioesterase [Anaerolineae bacterium]
MPDRRIEVALRVRYAETDALGVAYHSNYFVWFEVARSEYFRVVVGDSPAGFFQHYGMPLIEASARFLNPCRYDDLIVVAARVSELRSRSIEFEYEVRQEGDGLLLAVGRTAHICTDSGGKPCRIPTSLREALAS